MAYHKQNKGEWTELYVFLRLLGDADRTAYVGVQDGIAHPKSTVYRPHDQFKYHVTVKQVHVKDSTGAIKCKVSRRDIQNAADRLLAALFSEKGTFAVPDVEDFVRRKLFAPVTKAPGSLSSKDIEVKENGRGAEEYSIKSLIGANATLLNASGATAIIYRIKPNNAEPNFDFSALNRIGSVAGSEESRSKYKLRVQEAARYGRFSLYKFQSDVFANNLDVINPALTRLLPELLINSFISPDSKKKLSRIKKGTDFGSPEWNTSEYSEQTAKRAISYLLEAKVFKGLMPSKKLKDLKELQPTTAIPSGHLLVSKDGKLDVNNRATRGTDGSAAALLDSKFDSGKYGKQGAGMFYKEEGEWRIKLMLHIRMVECSPRL